MTYSFTDKINIKFVLLKNDPENGFIAELIIKNNSDEDIETWKLCYDHFRPSTANPAELVGESKEKAKFVKRIGEYSELLGNVVIPAYSQLVLKLSGNWLIRKLLDTPSCYFIDFGDNKIYEISGEADISIAKPRVFKQDSPKKNKLTNEFIDLIPVPASVKLHEGSFDFSKVDGIYNSSDTTEVNEIVNTIVESYSELICDGVNLELSEKMTSINIFKDETISIDSYRIKVDKNKVDVTANSRGGFLYGFISLLKLAQNYKNNIPCCEIEDYPRFTYRGNLFDIARNFRTVDEMKKYLKMLALYKVNVLHCRMTDDEGWRIEIKNYPNISEIGGFRGYKEIIPPFHGSGPNKYGGYYTQDEMLEIIDYANSLNITFLPEIVIPSHARALISSFTNYKGFDNPLIEWVDKSEYKTAQNFNDNILNPGLDFTYEVLENIFTEIAELFKVQQLRNMPYSDYIHVGVDEVPEGAWMKSPACKLLMEKYGLKNTDEIQFFFILKMQNFIKKLGYKIAGWEEVVNGGSTLDKDLIVYSWKGEEAGFDAAESDFSVVMCPVQFLYFDLAYSDEHNEPGLYWGGYNNPKIIYSYLPLEGETSIKIKRNIKGVQSCLWSENLGYPRRTNLKQLPERYQSCPYEYMAFPKMTAFSEVAWSKSENRDWDDFVKRYKSELNILEKMNICYRNINID